VKTFSVDGDRYNYYYTGVHCLSMGTAVQRWRLLVEYCWQEAK